MTEKVVKRLVALPSCEVLEVARADGSGELLVPLVRDAVRDVDVAEAQLPAAPAHWTGIPISPRYSAPPAFGTTARANTGSLSR